MSPSSTFLRAVAYVILGWFLIATVGALGRVFHLTLMLPMTSAIILTHFAFHQREELSWGLGVAIFLGYVADLHQGGVIGSLMLANALSFIALYWFEERIALKGLFSRAMASMLTAMSIHVLSLAILWVLSEQVHIASTALLRALWDMRWIWVATALASQPVWYLCDAMLRMVSEGLSWGMLRKQDDASSHYRPIQVREAEGNSASKKKERNRG